MVGKKGPRTLLVASVGVATINYALIGCDTFAPADEEGVTPDTFVTGGKSFGTTAGSAPIFPTGGTLLPGPIPMGGIGGGGFAGQTFGGAAGGGMGGISGGGMGGISAGSGGDAATGGDASGGDAAGGADGAAGDAAGGADGAGGDASGGADGAGGVGGAP